MEQSKGRARGRGRGERGRARLAKDSEVPRPGQQQQPGPSPQPAPQPAPPPAVSAWGPRPGLAQQGVPQGPGPGPAQHGVPQGPGPGPHQQGIPRGPGPGPGMPQGPRPMSAQQGMPQGAMTAPPQTTVAPGQAEPSVMMSGGRAVRRGTSRAADPRLPGDVAEVQQGMQQMAIQEEGAVGEPPALAQQQLRRRTREEFLQDRFGGPQFRSQDLVNKQGTSGKPVTVRGNYFRLTVPRNWTLYQYHVDFFPPCEGTKMRKALLYSHDQLLGPVKAFDGMILFLPHQLEHNEVVVYSNRRSDNANIKITISLRCAIRSVTPATLQVMNIILRKILGIMKMKQINRHYFDVENKIPVPRHNLEVIPGFQTSILYYEQDTMLDIDLTHKILRTTTVLEHMYHLHRTLPPDQFHRLTEKEVVGMIVMTRYNNKTYQVDDIAWEKRVTDIFDRNGNSVSFLQYYQSQYGIEIRNHDQPMLIIKCKKRDVRAGKGDFIMLVPELCYITGLTEANRADFNLKRDLATHTRVGPDMRAKKLTKFMMDVTTKPEVAHELGNWNLGLDSQLVAINARQLEKEDIIMFSGGKEGKLDYNQQEADWSRDMRGKQFKLSVSVPRRKWLIVFPRNSRSNAESLVQTLNSVGPPMGMNFGEPEVIELENDRNDTYYNALRRGVQVPDTKMAVCVLPNNRKDRYDAIKKFCCIDVPVPSQCVVDRTLQNGKRLMSVATKIAIQMNCKLGGIIWTVPIPLPSTMIIGLDTYHDSSKRGRSVAAVVASISKDHARYFSTCVFQMSHQELANQLQGCITACMRAYMEENKVYPQKVMVFRDGVGDGQLALVHDHEIPQIKAAIGDLKLSFVVVKKRTNARFFLETGGMQQAVGRGDRGGSRGAVGGQTTYTNPGPGTIIDDVVTKRDWFDFFLISQSVREGTVSPTHYNVLLNEMELKPEHMQRLAYKLCHMYYNWQGTIRVPAPCMYAHKMAFLVGQSLHTEPSKDLAKHLYYL